MWVELIVGHPFGVAETCLLVWETNTRMWWPQESEVKCSVWKKRSHLRGEPAGPPDMMPISTWETYCSSQLCRCGKGSIKRSIHPKSNSFQGRSGIWVSKAVLLTLCQADLFLFFLSGIKCSPSLSSCYSFLCWETSQKFDDSLFGTTLTPLHTNTNFLKYIKWVRL